MQITDEVKVFARQRGADLVGITTVDRLRGAPKGHRPRDFLPGAKCVICVAIRLNYAPIENLPVTRREYDLNFHVVNDKLDHLVYELARFLEDRGYTAIPFRATDGDEKTFFGDVSHKHVAAAAGLGEFGLNNLIITPEFGSRIRLASVVTNAPLDPDPPLAQKICKECGECVKACPSGALEIKTAHNPLKGRVVNKEKCYHYMFVVLGNLKCGICIKACPIGKNC